MPVWDTLGKVRITPKGLFDNTQAYDILDAVYNPNMNKIYIAKQSVPENSSLSDATYWIKMLDVSDAVIVLGDAIANNLTTTTEGKILDARQGKALKDANDLKLSKTDVVNDLVTTEAGKALDARQGKTLSDTKLDKDFSGLQSATTPYTNADLVPMYRDGLVCKANVQLLQSVIHVGTYVLSAGTINQEYSDTDLDENMVILAYYTSSNVDINLTPVVTTGSLLLTGTTSASTTLTLYWGRKV